MDNLMHQMLEDPDQSEFWSIDDDLQLEADIERAFQDILEDDYPVIVSKKYENGCVCDTCEEICPYAEGPNQKNGKFRCYSCRTYG